MACSGMPGDWTPRWHPIDPASEANLTLFQRIMLRANGTVTELLALYTGRPVQVCKIQQEFCGKAPADLRGPFGLTGLHRTVLLQTDAAAPLLHATSYFAAYARSATIRRDVSEFYLPIGILWRREGVEMFREIVACRRGVMIGL